MENGEGQELQKLLGFVRTKRYDAAIEGLQRFLTRFPDNEVATGLLAAAYFELGLPDKAQAGYQRALELNPANALARFQLGMVHLSRGEHRAALDAWGPLAADPTDFMARFHSALAHVELGNTAEARVLLEQAAQNMPSSHPLFTQLKALRARLAGETVGTSGYRQ